MLIVNHKGDIVSSILNVDDKLDDNTTSEKDKVTFFRKLKSKF